MEAQDFEALQLFEGFNWEARWAMQVIGASYGGDSFAVVSIVSLASWIRIDQLRRIGL